MALYATKPTYCRGTWFHPGEEIVMADPGDHALMVSLYGATEDSPAADPKPAPRAPRTVGTSEPATKPTPARRGGRYKTRRLKSET